MIAVVGLAVNLVTAWILYDSITTSTPCRGRRPAPADTRDHNIRAAYFHVLADAMTSVLAIAACLPDGSGLDIHGPADGRRRRAGHRPLVDRTDALGRRSPRRSVPIARWPSSCVGASKSTATGLPTCTCGVSAPVTRA